MGDSARQDHAARYSHAVQAKGVVDVPLGGAADFTWNSFQRDLYEKANEAIQRQANELLRRGNVTYDEAQQLVEVQRNGLVIEMREPLTPFGRYYSEVLKPTSELKTLDQLLAEKGSIELVLRSVGRSRQAVNRMALVARRAGPALIAVDVVLTIVIIDLAPADKRGEVAAGQAGGIAGSALGARYGGLAGAWAGATTFAALGSPTLVIPVVGEVTEGGAVLVGGIAGFLFGGWFGWEAGQAAGTKFWHLCQVMWVRAP
ncbi:MAG TPA: hypothetical protein VMU82_02515 [Acetobacteraceae bacterium]|nr:hypothetical protein [Acetobacteraceae bacterium]